MAILSDMGSTFVVISNALRLLRNKDSRQAEVVETRAEETVAQDSTVKLASSSRPVLHMFNSRSNGAYSTLVGAGSGAGAGAVQVDAGPGQRAAGAGRRHRLAGVARHRSRLADRTRPALQRAAEGRRACGRREAAGPVVAPCRHPAARSGRHRAADAGTAARPRRVSLHAASRERGGPARNRPQRAVAPRASQENACALIPNLTTCPRPLRYSRSP